MCEQLRKLLLGHASLLRAHLLDAHSEYSRPLCEVVDVAAGLEELQHIPILYGAPLLLIEAEQTAVSVFVTPERLTIGGFIEGEAHPVQGVSLHGRVSIEDDGSGNVIVTRYTHARRDGTSSSIGRTVQIQPVRLNLHNRAMTDRQE
jgi:hypothetical protein